MAEIQSKTYNISGFQKTLLGIAIAFYGLYKFVLTDAGIIKNLGISYPWVMMIWTIIMLFCAGFSGWEMAIYLIDFAKDKLKKGE